MRSMWKQVLVVSLVLLLAGVSSPVLAQQLVNMEFQQAPLVDVFQILGQIGGYNVLVDPSVSGNVSFTLNDLTVEEALDLVTRTTGYRYQIVGNTMVVASQQRLKSEFGTQDFTFCHRRACACGLGPAPCLHGNSGH
jgi:type II secretory pathway component HofQ